VRHGAEQFDPSRRADPLGLEAAINQIVGVVSNGLFARRGADVLLLGTQAGVQTMVK